MDSYGLTEEEQKTNLRRYNHALFRNMMFFMDIVWEIDVRTGTVVVLEDKLEPEQAHREYAYQELYQDYLDRRVQENSREIFRDRLSFEAVKALQEETSVDLRLLSAAGEPTLHRVALTPSRDENGTLDCVYMGVRDMLAEERRVMAEYNNLSQYQGAIESSIELRSSNEKLKRTLSQEEQFRLASLSGALMVYNINLTKNLIEDEFYEIVDGERYPMLQLVGLTAPCSFDEFCRRWCERKVREDSRETCLKMFNRQYMLDAYARGEKVVEIEFDTVIGRGIPVTLRTTALLIADQESGDLLAMCSGKDVSAQRSEEFRQREALRTAFQAANNANAAKSNFLARMSHDIRTPMNAIIGMTAIAGAHIEDQARVADCLNKIAVSSKHLLGLINEVLDMSKIEFGKVDLQDEAFNLPELVDNLLTMCKPQLAEKNHELSVFIHGIVHEKVVGDSQRIQQVFMNLMGNAIKYTPPGGKISLSITETATNRPLVGCYEFIFEDNGIGMSKEFVDRMFEPFSRAEDSRVARTQGTGLGMAITKNIVQMMNGSIQVDSELDRGTRMTVTIFLKLQNEGEELDYDSLLDLPILVADDDEMACESTCEVLEELGMKGEWVLSGEEAVDRVVRRHRDDDDYYAVILDWKMPGMDGLATAKEIRRQVGDAVPIIIISAFDWSDIEVQARAAGVNAFIGKPLFKSRMARLFQELRGDRTAANRRPSLEIISQEDFSGSRALLAEDNDLNAEIAIEILSSAGLSVDWVKNGRDAVEKLSSSPDGTYDLVFMDIQMPDMDGYAATKAIRALDRPWAATLPILAMSANAFAEDVRASLAAGMNEHLAKPLDLVQLDRALKKFLPGRIAAVKG